jgi:hypothetical protein
LEPGAISLTRAERKRQACHSGGHASAPELIRLHEISSLSTGNILELGSVA